MPKVTFRDNFSAGADGSLTWLQTIDISALLSAHYGRLIRQSNAFKIKSAHVRVYNPNVGVQDQHLSASGRLAFYEPTGNRKKAYKNAFTAVQRLRRMIGLKEKNYDFRVGLEENFPEVAQQAWIKSESDELYLGGSGQVGIFNVHNEMLPDLTLPQDPDLNGFGFPFDLPGLGIGDFDLKEGTGDDGFYTPGKAKNEMETIPFMVGMGGAFDNLGTDDHFGATNAEHIDMDTTVMCGLVGVMVDTTVPDDTETQTIDVGLEITLDIESWSPMLGGKKKRSKRKSSRRSKK